MIQHLVVSLAAATLDMAATHFPPIPAAEQTTVEDAAFSPPALDPNDPDAQFLSAHLRDFVALKRGQLMAASENGKFTIHPEFHLLFDAVARCDNVAVATSFRRIRPGIGQYERHPGDPEKPDPALWNAAWQYALEVYGTWEQVALWSPGLLRMYGADMTAGIPEGAVFFGGTDPGRFVVNALGETVHTNRFRVITQNALADVSYLEYARRLHGEALSLPSSEDNASAFQTFVADIQEGRRPNLGQISVENGRVQVTGAIAVMEINGILAKMIFERNRERNPFFVEESYVIPWMFDYLSPHGLVMKLNAEKTPITDSMAAEDFRFWDDYENKLFAHGDFATDYMAQKTFSKLRCAIAGLYAVRNRPADAEKAFAQAIRLSPESPEAHYRLVQEVLGPQKRFDEAIAAMMQFRERLPKFVEICAALTTPTDLESEQRRVDDVVWHFKAMRDSQKPVPAP